MNCPNCHQATEPGAAFCGNCGHPLQSAAAQPTDVNPGQGPSPIARVLQNQLSQPANTRPPNGPLSAVDANGLVSGVPSYAIASPAQHATENKATLALLFGSSGIIGLMFIPLIGLAFGMVGIIMGTMSRSGAKRGLSTAGIALSGLSLLGGLAVWTYAVQHDPALNKTASRTNSHSIAAPAVLASNLSTPCYAVGFVTKFSVTNNADSCDMNAFNGPTPETPTEIYKVYANQSPTADAQNFAGLAKLAIEKDLKSNLPDFSIDNERVTQFAGSPAYIVSSSDSKHDLAVIEAAVLHQTTNGKNVFILVHAVDGKTTDLDTLEAQWQWK